MVVYVAICLLVIVILVVGILFAPFRYKMQFSTREPYMLDFQFRWWIRKIFYFHIRYEQNKPLVKEYLVVGKVKAGTRNNYEEWLAHRVEEELKNAQDEVIYTDLEGEIDVVEDTPNRINSIELDAKGHRINSEPLEQEGKILKDGNKFDSKQSFEKEKEKSELGKFWFMPYITDTRFYEVIFLFLRRVYNHSTIRTFCIEGRFGLGDPAKTGILAGLLYTMCPKHMGHIEFDFLDFSYGSSGYLKGRIVPAYLIWFGLCLVMTQPIRGFLITVIKVIKEKRAKDARRRKQTIDSNVQVV